MDFEVWGFGVWCDETLQFEPPKFETLKLKTLKLLWNGQNRPAGDLSSKMPELGV